MKRILVIGGGSIGERHVRCFGKTGRATVSLCEVNEALRQQVAQAYHLTSTFATLVDALQQPHDGAVICTPAHLHIPMALQLAEAGIGLLIEKPLSIQLDGIAELRSLVAKKNLPAGVAYVMRHHPALAAVRAAVKAQQFGSPVQIDYVGGQHFPYYRPAYREIYYTRHETGGGAIQDALTHMVNAAEWLVGPVTRLVADAAHCVLEGVTVEDTVHLLTRHQSLPGCFSLNQHQPVNEANLTVMCEAGIVRFEVHSGRWLSCREPNTPWNVEHHFQLERDDMFVRQADAFIDQLEGKAAASCSLDEAEQTLKVNLAALQSVRQTKWITL